MSRSTPLRPARLGIFPLVALSLLALGAAACSKAPSSAGTRTTVHSATTLPPLPPKTIAYVALVGSGANIGTGSEVVPVDLTQATPAAGAPITVGTFPDSIGVAPGGRTAYVANYASNTVTPIDLQTGKAGAPIPAGSGPAGIAIAPDGQRAYVTDDGSGGTLGDTVTPIDLLTGKALPAIKVGLGPQGIAITPDGTTAYVADAGAMPSLQQSGPAGRTVTPIDLQTGKAGAPIVVGNGPVSVAIPPNGGIVYVGNLDSQSVTPISIGSGTALSAIPVPGGPVALAATAQSVWVVDTPSNTSKGDNVVEISVSGGSAGLPIKVPAGVQCIALSPDNSTAWVTSLTAGELTPINLSTRAVGPSIKIAGGPFAIAVASVPQGGPPAPPAATTTTAPKTSGATSTT